MDKVVKEVLTTPQSIQFETITEKMNHLYISKNHDYGNSFDQSCDEFGLTAALIRMSDKMNRLKALADRPDEAKIFSESIEDTLIDIANYAVMSIMWLQNKQE